MNELDEFMLYYSANKWLAENGAFTTKTVDDLITKEPLFYKATFKRKDEEEISREGADLMKLTIQIYNEVYE